MIFNDKFYLPPPKNNSDLKTLLRWLSEEGVGRPVDLNGNPIGPWSPELLADTISQNEVNQDGIELRTVQLWFEDNERGVSQENIRRLATIFGCGDVDCIREWRVGLTDAKSLLKSKRQDGRKNAVSDTSTKNRRKLALFSEALFKGQNSLNLSVVLWAGCTGIGFLAYILGVHSITYSPIVGLEKQVGFLWAPSWTILQLIFLPLFLMIVADLMTFWKEKGRPLLVLPDTAVEVQEGWLRKVESYNLSHLAVFFICFALVFLLQWAGMYFRPIMLGDAGNLIVDWSNITTERPEVMSVPTAVLLSMISFLYAGCCVFLFLTGLVFLYTVSRDYYELCGSQDLKELKDHKGKVRHLGTKITFEIFRCTVLGILIASSIKIYAVYLKSDGQNIATWIIDDLLFLLNVREGEAGWLGNYALGDFSSFLLLFTTCFVFFLSLFQSYRVHAKLSTSEAADKSNGVWQGFDIMSRIPAGWLKSVSVVVLLIANYVLIGQFSGFSILLLVSIFVATSSMINREDGF